ncbi:MAG: bacteriorhodopsin [Microbacteriaceae bacterium]|nr:bacteriorhodopsin [Microbacteriaceae bacterium]
MRRTSVASASYLAILFALHTTYHSTAAGFDPDGSAVLVSALRYTDWSITVLLLTAQLLSVCVSVGTAARRTRMIAIGSAFLMIFTGFFGATGFGGPLNIVMMLLWGAISGLSWAITTVVLIRAVVPSLLRLTSECAVLLRRATIMLISGWIVYPVVLLIQAFTGGGSWATAVQITLCVTAVVITIGFGGLVHGVAKLRTGGEVRVEDDVHPELIWTSSVKRSDAGSAPAVCLATDAESHQRRRRPPSATAVAAERDPKTELPDGDR